MLENIIGEIKTREIQLMDEDKYYYGANNKVFKVRNDKRTYALKLFNNSLAHEKERFF